MQTRKLTLIELLISLAILAALSTIVLDNIIDRELRIKEIASVELGKEIQNSITGKNNHNNASHFLSDLGRWPTVNTEYLNGERNNARNLAQLYDRTIFYHNSTTSTMLARPVAITITKNVLNLPINLPNNFVLPTVTMFVGWNGPYITPPRSASGNLYDGWGTPWNIIRNFQFKRNNTQATLEEQYIIDETPTTNTEIEGIVSFGADNKEGGSTPSDLDQTFLFPKNTYLATLNITIRVRDPNDPKKWNALKFENNSTNLPTDANTVTPDCVRLLLFSPAKRKINENNSAMEAGFFCLAPYTNSATIDQTDPRLKYCYEPTLTGTQNIGFDTDSTTDSEFDNSTDIDELNTNKLRAALSWEHTITEIPSIIRVERLVPGKRIIYCFAGYNNGTGFSSVATSELETIDLRPGENHLTIYLEQHQIAVP